VQLRRSAIPSQRLPWHVRYHVSPDDDDDDDDDDDVLSHRTISRSDVPATRSTTTLVGSTGFAQPTTVNHRHMPSKLTATIMLPTDHRRSEVALQNDARCPIASPVTKKCNILVHDFQ